MDKAKIAYAGYMFFFLLFVGSMIIVPFLAFRDDMGFAYDAFVPTCHQKLSRSLCIFNGNESYWIADCTTQNEGYVSDLNDRRGIRVESGGVVGYKMPVCSRDFGIYFAMLLAGAIYPFVRRLELRSMYPAAYLILAMVPIAIDGGLQLLTEIDKPLFGSNIMPFEYESTNLMRLLTGVIAGFAASFYAIPILVNIFGGPVYEKRAEEMRIDRQQVGEHDEVKKRAAGKTAAASKK
ncbi:MAG: DUF2085 domain-containing protein [Candidatus Micrarchaeota archaeon]